MFKITGIILVIFSTVFVSSQKILEYRFTHNFFTSVTEIIKQIQYENTINQTYKKVFQKIDFDLEKFLNKAKGNGYIKRGDIKTVQMFFEGLGKRDRTAEYEYILYNLEKFESSAENYFLRYSEAKKTHLLCGISTGMIIIIFFI